MRPKFLWHVSDVRNDGTRSFNLFIHRRPKWSMREMRKCHYRILCSIAHERCPVDSIAGSAQHEFVKVSINRNNRAVVMNWDRYLEFTFDRRVNAERFLRWSRKLLGGRWVQA